jgi:hypothetical protein
MLFAWPFLSATIYALDQLLVTEEASLKRIGECVLVRNGTNALKRMVVCLAFQVGGMHFNLLKRIQHDAAQKGLQLSTDEALDALLPNFKAHIEPDLNQAQVPFSLYILQPCLVSKRSLYIFFTVLSLLVQ